MKGLILPALALWLVGCSPMSKGDDISDETLKQISSLNLIDANEKVLLFDTQKDIQHSGNFVAENHIGSYWIDDHDSSKCEYYSAHWTEVSDLKLTDRSKAWTMASMIEVSCTDGREFEVYVDDDSANVHYFFELAKNQWTLATQ